MEITPERNPSTSFLDSLNFIEKGGSKEAAGRVNSSQKMKYDAEVLLIKNKWGDLEAIRNRLGLSQRKMAQLLMVDPSAWTRWTKPGKTTLTEGSRGESEAPPHVYRALSWFLTLQEKDPHAHPYYWLASVSQPSLPEKEISHLKQRLRGELKGQLEGEMLQTLAQKLKLWRWIFIGQTLILLALIFLKFK